jgi:ATP-dependent RNA helicase RhlE
VDSYAAHLPLRCAAVFGGVKINPQIARLRQGTDILIATPGRLLDLHQQGGVSFEELEILVLDEADRMLDMGFIHDIRRIIELLPIPRQNLLFSATFSAEIRKLSGTILQRPLAVQLSAANTTAAKVEQWLHPVDKKRKPALLHELIASQGWTQVLVFTRTRQGANRLGQQLQEAGLGTEVIHSSRNQDARTPPQDALKQGARVGGHGCGCTRAGYCAVTTSGEF